MLVREGHEVRQVTLTSERKLHLGCKLPLISRKFESLIIWKLGRGGMI